VQPSDESADPRDRIFELTSGTRGIGRRAGGASIMVLVVSFFKVALQLGSIAILARLIPPAEYAVFVLALPGVVIATALSNFGLRASFWALSRGATETGLVASELSSRSYASLVGYKKLLSSITLAASWLIFSRALIPWGSRRKNMLTFTRMWLHSV